MCVLFGFLTSISRILHVAFVIFMLIIRLEKRRGQKSHLMYKTVSEDNAAGSKTTNTTIIQHIVDLWDRIFVWIVSIIVMCFPAFLAGCTGFTAGILHYRTFYFYLQN